MSEHTGLEFAPQSPRSQNSPSMPPLVLFIISMGVSTWQIIIVFVMCSRHHRQIRDLFVMCSRHQSYLPLFVIMSCLFERLQQISAKAFARFAHWTVVLLRFRPNKSSKYWKIKTRRTRKKVQNSEACILGIKNIRLTWGLLPVLIFIYVADFSCKMKNELLNSAYAGYRNYSDRGSASADNADGGLNNSDILRKPNSIILKW